MDKEKNEVEIHIPHEARDGYINNKRELHKFKFSGMFD